MNPESLTKSFRGSFHLTKMINTINQKKKNILSIVYNG